MSNTTSATRTYLPEGTTKKQALRQLRLARKSNPSIKLFLEGGIYCQPSKGLASFERFFLA